MLYLSDIEEALGSLDSVNMVNIFDIDKYDHKTEMEELYETMSPYLSMLSPLDRTLYEMYFVHNAKAEHLALYLDVSTTAIYKRLRSINFKLKMVIYLNLTKEELHRILSKHFINNSEAVNYFVQFIFHRTSKQEGAQEAGFNFKTIQLILDKLKEAISTSPENINSHTLSNVKRNCKKHKLYFTIKKVVQVCEYVIEKKAYRYNIFRGSLEGEYIYSTIVTDDEEEGQEDD
jgi:proline dehydrogenase